MALVEVTWRECPRQKIKMNRAYDPPSPYLSELEVDHPRLLTGADAAAMILEAQVDAHPDEWDSFDYVIEILGPDNLAGRFAVEVIMEARCEAVELDDENERKVA